MQIPSNMAYAITNTLALTNYSSLTKNFQLVQAFSEMKTSLVY